MKYLSKIITSIALCNMAFGPWAHAQVKAQQTSTTSVAAAPLSYNFRFNSEKNVTEVLDRNKTVVMEFPMASKEKISEFSPKRLNARILAEMKKVGASSKSAWSHSVKSLPTESMVFFVSMGAVVATQVFTNFSQNPVGFEQHLEHQLSPLGSLGFFSFMYSQGVTSNLLMMSSKNPTFLSLIPYFGMTVGAFVQNYLSSFASDPNVKICAKSLMHAADITEKDGEAACEAAYEYFTAEKFWEFAPGVASMLISSALAAAGQNVMTKVALRLTGVDLALWLTPGGFQLKGIRLLLVKGLQITAFTALDALIARSVSYVWKNIFDGAEFYDRQDRLNELVNQLKIANWNSETKDLNREISKFGKKMSDWRMMNMSDVYEAHQNWSQALEQLTSMYASAQAYYADLVGKAQEHKKGNDPATLHLLPLTGVKADGLQKGMENLYFGFPERMIYPQFATLQKAAQQIDMALAKSDEELFLFPKEKDGLKEISKLFKMTDEDKAAEGLKKLATLRESIYQNTSTQDFIGLMENIWATIGEPLNPKGLGQAYNALFEKYSDAAQVLKRTSYYRVTGAFQTPNITDYLTMQIMCGPDVTAGGQVVRSSKGFASVFAPPSLTENKGDIFNCSAVGLNLPSEQIYNRNFDVMGKKYPGSFEYILSNMKPALFSAEGNSNFDDWWKKNTESQVKEAFADYESKYQTIMVRLVRGIFNTEKSIFNGANSSLSWAGFKGIWDKKQAKRNIEGGPIMNGALQSSFQEERIYLSLLEELLKPSTNFELDFSTVLGKTFADPRLKKIDQEFSKLSQLLLKLKIITVKGKDDYKGKYSRFKNAASAQQSYDIVQSDLENYELEEQVAKISAAIKEVEDSFSDALAERESLGRRTAPGKRQIALVVSTQLRSLANEIAMYGQMANAVSWEKMSDSKRSNLEQTQIDRKLEETKGKIQGLLGARY